ncbi:MAG: PFL family protein [Prevotellaceae bacterium]|nr:PFL family protein [Candidatus Minthosoma caballi]
MINISEVFETNKMIEQENLDVRTITMGINLLDCADTNLNTTCEKIYKKITVLAKDLVKTGEEISREFAIPIVNKRISITPISLVGSACCKIPGDYVQIAKTLDKAAKEVGVNFLGGYSAIVSKGMTKSDELLIRSIPKAMACTERICSSINVGSTKTGINMDAVRLMGDIIKATAEETKENDSLGCAKLVVLCNAPDDNPFMAGAFHGVSEADAIINVGVSGPGVVKYALEQMDEASKRLSVACEDSELSTRFMGVQRRKSEADSVKCNGGDTNSSLANFETLCETIKKTAFKITRVGQLVAQEASARLGVPFGIIDLSLAPTPAVGDSVADILHCIGVEHAGAPGTTAALALLNDQVKKGGVMASSYVGGLSGAFIPVSEDQGMIDAVEAGALTIEKLEAMTCVCSVGLDMIAIPGDTPATTIAGIIADESAIGMINQKTTAVRIIPVIGKTIGDTVEFGGLLGYAPIMPVNTFDCSHFVNRTGRIPAPIHSFKN